MADQGEATTMNGNGTEEAHRPLALKSSNHESIYDYYLSLQADGAMARYADFDVSEIRDQSPYIYMSRLVKQGSEQRFRFQMVGEKLVAFFKQDGRGRFIREMRLGGWEHEWRETQLLTLERRAPVVAESIIQDDKLRIDLEHIAMPLSDYYGQIIYIVGSLDIVGFLEGDPQKVGEGFTWDNLLSFDIIKRASAE